MILPTTQDALCRSRLMPMTVMSLLDNMPMLAVGRNFPDGKRSSPSNPDASLLSNFIWLYATSELLPAGFIELFSCGPACRHLLAPLAGSQACLVRLSINVKITYGVWHSGSLLVLTCSVESLGGAAGMFKCQASISDLSTMLGVCAAPVVKACSRIPHTMVLPPYRLG